VQRLAERAANATKQIEVLVRTIQTDTNEAVVSMERSTTDVVGGALLAENAGAALEEIEQVSNQIASLVQNISGSARQQTHAAQNIARNMQALKEISGQTANRPTRPRPPSPSWPSSPPACASPPRASVCRATPTSASSRTAPSGAWGRHAEYGEGAADLRIGRLLDSTAKATPCLKSPPRHSISSVVK